MIMLAFRPSTRPCLTRKTVQPSSQCKSHDAGATTHTIDEAYGAQHSRSTRGMMFQDRCRRVVRNKAHFHGKLSSTTFPAAAETPYKVQQQWTTTSRLLANPDAGGSSERWILQLYSIVCAQLQVELELKLC